MDYQHQNSIRLSILNTTFNQSRHHSIDYYELSSRVAKQKLGYYFDKELSSQARQRINKMRIDQSKQGQQRSLDTKYRTIEVQDTAKPPLHKQLKLDSISPIRPQNYQDRQNLDIRRKKRFGLEFPITPSLNSQITITVQLNSDQMSVDEPCFRRLTRNNQNVLDKIRRDKQWIINNLAKRYSLKIAQTLAAILEIPKYLDFNTWRNIRLNLLKIHKEGIIVIMFKLFDFNNDKYVCSSDLFKIKTGIPINNSSLDQDICHLIKFIQTNLNQQSVDEEEYYYLQKSLILKHDLTIRELVTWNEIYQQDQTQEIKNKKGLHYQRQFPFKSFIGSDHYFRDYCDNSPQDTFLSRYPHKYQKSEAFSLNFCHFRRAFLNVDCCFWNDFVEYFSGNQPQ